MQKRIYATITSTMGKLKVVLRPENQSYVFFVFQNYVTEPLID